jgi:hypothetical protein
LHTGYHGDPDWWPFLAVRDGQWKLVISEKAERMELHDLGSDRAEDAGRDESKAHPEIVARLRKLVLEWKATLPTQVDPTCVSSTSDANAATRGRKGATSAPPLKNATKDRNIPFNRWDTDKDGFLTLDEYKTGQQGGENIDARFKNFDKNGDGKLSREEFVDPRAK